MKKKLVLSLGSNLGNRYAFILRAIKEIEKSFDTKSIIANFYETPPWGKVNQPQFINTAVYCYTDIPILQCFDKIQTIEEGMKSFKAEKWGPRTIDIDLLFYESDILRTDDLIVPHHHLHERAFVLKPLQDILPNFIHPLENKTINQLIKNVVDDTILFLKAVDNE
jgi:2-amino-4-hydroxy-6-hydroxymethyldihydropteridine diphosphokinase|tara:strand:+ start:26 stop:523 length:498 start_codon:yes stop_codon:yes gene_type:complete